MHLFLPITDIYAREILDSRGNPAVGQPFFVKSEWIPTQKDTSTSPFRGQPMCFYSAYFAARPFFVSGGVILWQTGRFVMPPAGASPPPEAFYLGRCVNRLRISRCSRGLW